MNGKFKLSSLPNGKRYTLEETVVPDGFESNGLGQQVYINIDAAGNTSISQPNTNKIYSYYEVTPLDQDNIITVTNERKPKEEEPEEPENPEEPVDPSDPADDPKIPEDLEEPVTPDVPEDTESPETPNAPADTDTPESSVTAKTPKTPEIPVRVSAPKVTQVTVKNTLLPKTGESKNVLAIAGGVLAAAGFFGLVARMKRKKP